VSAAQSIAAVFGVICVAVIVAIAIAPHCISRADIDEANGEEADEGSATDRARRLALGISEKNAAALECKRTDGGAR
jgi:NhaP-type Na+/H+ or K+/H+ antiporter